MNKDIEKYTKDVLLAFYYYLFLYEGQLLNNWITNVNILFTDKDGKSNKFNNNDIDELIRIFLEWKNL